MIAIWVHKHLGVIHVKSQLDSNPITTPKLPTRAPCINDMYR